MKNKKIKVTILLLILVILAFGSFILFNNLNDSELQTITSKKDLEKIYDGDMNYNSESNLFTDALGMPFTFFAKLDDVSYNYVDYTGYNDLTEVLRDSDGINPSNYSSKASNESSFSNDFSTTNIQVENVDEADITKTDGNYIYSISESDVIVTNARNPEDLKISYTINITDGIPEDLILYKDKLVVISSDLGVRASSYYKQSSNTIVKIYDVKDKEKITLTKSYTLHDPYYTSRCIDNKLYVISCGNLRKENDNIVTYYTEDNSRNELELNDISYLKSIHTKKQTLISMLDLDDEKSKLSVKSYLFDISNAYVSQNSIYLLNYKYEYSYNATVPPVSSLFGLTGAFGPFIYENNDIYNNYGYYTQIYKFDILKNGEIKYNSKTEIKGKTINQFSLDEYNENLRVALFDDNGSRVVIFDKQLKILGETPYLAPGETMYSSRFLGDKAYLVTYKNVDPLYVIDVSNPTNPTVLGELKIPRI